MLVGPAALADSRCCGPRTPPSRARTAGSPSPAGSTVPIETWRPTAGLHDQPRRQRPHAPHVQPAARTSGVVSPDGTQARLHAARQRLVATWTPTVGNERAAARAFRRPDYTEPICVRRRRQHPALTAATTIWTVRDLRDERRRRDSSQADATRAATGGAGVVARRRTDRLHSATFDSCRRCDVGHLHDYSRRHADWTVLTSNRIRSSRQSRLVARRLAHRVHPATGRATS